MPSSSRARLLMPVRWSDVDLFGHVNNAAFLRYLDDARFATFPQMGVDSAGTIAEIVLVVVKHEIDYVSPVSFTPDPIAVEVWVSRVGSSSVDFGYEVLRPDGSQTHLLARSRMVQVDRVTGRPHPFDGETRIAFEAVHDVEPVLRAW